MQRYAKYAGNVCPKKSPLGRPSSIGISFDALLTALEMGRVWASMTVLRKKGEKRRLLIVAQVALRADLQRQLNEKMSG